MSSQYDREFWPHAPLHRLTESGVYFVTAATHGKKHHFSGAMRVGVVCRGLLTVCHEANWRIEAWAVFSNHYHFVAHAPPTGAESLRDLLSRLHARTAHWINRLDRAEGRQVWHNFWETQLTFERSYLARLQYVHENPVKHGLVTDARERIVQRAGSSKSQPPLSFGQYSRFAPIPCMSTTTTRQFPIGNRGAFLECGV
jgi:putative transposase